MAMKNPVFDKDLTSLLKNCDNTDLDPIVETILSLPSETLSKRPEYLEHKGDHRSYIDALVYEITSLGGHTLANLIRGRGVDYADMVGDVASKLDVVPEDADTVETLEEKIILRILRLGSAHMSDDDRVALRDLLELEGEDSQHIPAEAAPPNESGELSQELGRDVTSGVQSANGGLERGSDDAFPEAEASRRIADSATALAGDRIAQVVEHVVRTTRLRRTMVAASKAAIFKAVTMPLGGPLSWAIAIGRGLHDLMGPNYAASLSLVAHIGLLRQKYEQIERDLSNDEAHIERIALT